MTSGGEIRIIVVDDQAVVRQGFVSLISTVADMRVIAQGTNGREAVALYREHRPDVVLMDLRMPEMGGVEAISAIRREFSDAKVIVLTTYDGDEDIYRAIEAGARGYLLKDTFPEGTLGAIRDVHAGGSMRHERIGAAYSPISSSREQESAVLPQADDIFTRVLGCF